MAASLRTLALASLCVAQLALAAEAEAQQFLFGWSITADDGVVPAESGFEFSNDVRDLGEDLGTPSLTRMFPDLNFTSPTQVGIDGRLNLRGVFLDVAFLPGSTELVVKSNLLGLDLHFDAGDRDESADLFQQWLTGTLHPTDAPDAGLTTLLQALVDYSAVDPVAGNPNSLQSRMFEAAYFTGTSGVYRPRPGSPRAIEWRGKDHFRVQARYDRFSAGPWSGNVWEIGLDYQFNFRNPKFAILLDLPFVVSQTEGSESYVASAGVGFQWRPTHWWNLTPSVRFGAAGSFKLGAVAFMANANLTSSMRWEIGSGRFTIGGRQLGTPDFELGIGNMFGWNGTFDDLEISDVRIAYDLDNYAIRNGIDLTKRFGSRFLGGKPMVKLYFTDTWILGSELFLDHYNELGLQTGTQSQTGGKWRDDLALSAGWVFGNHYDAIQLKLSYRF